MDRYVHKWQMNHAASVLRYIPTFLRWWNWWVLWPSGCGWNDVLLSPFFTVLIRQGLHLFSQLLQEHSNASSSCTSPLLFVFTCVHIKLTWQGLPPLNTIETLHVSLSPPSCSHLVTDKVLLTPTISVTHTSTSEGKRHTHKHTQPSLGKMYVMYVWVLSWLAYLFLLLVKVIGLVEVGVG